MDSLDPTLRAILAAPIYGLAYVCAALVFRAMARRRGLATSGVWHLMQAGLIGGLVGANLSQLLFTGGPGKAIEGGIAGGWIAVVIMKRQLGIVRPTGDLFAPALALGEGIGRIGCFVVGCCYGKAAAVAWAVHDHDAFRHPAQLYLSAAAFASFAILMALERRRVLPENSLFYVQGMLFCAVRFAIEFFREAPATPIGFTLVQVACACGFVVFAALLTRALARSSIVGVRVPAHA